MWRDHLSDDVVDYLRQRARHCEHRAQRATSEIEAMALLEDAQLFRHEATRLAAALADSDAGDGSLNEMA